MTTDILLVNPVFLSQNETEKAVMTPYFPLGLLYLAGFLRERGFSVEVFDGTFTDGIDNFAAILAESHPRVVGITAVQPNRETALNLAEIAHDAGATVILGGPDATSNPEVYLLNRAVDLIVHHEGELTLVELLGTLLGRESYQPKIKTIEGIAFRDDRGEVVINPRRPYILNLDELPLPARDLIDMENYMDVWREHHGYTSMTISVARGCPYGCKWCESAVHGQDFRLRSPESVVAEVKSLMEIYEIDRLRVVDDVDGIDRQWIEEWAKVAEAEEAVVLFEPLYESKRLDVPLLDIRDSL
ncbi:MAG: cobalamin-dependent protein [Anaerolineales bacterium]|nr:cobalamin-dependent protein [Anaerolineales bacterium]